MFSALALCAMSAVACAHREPGALSSAPAIAASAAPASAPTPATAGGAPAEPVRAGGRMVMSEIQLSLRSESPARLADRASLAASRAGGFVLSRDAASSEESVVRVAMVLRVPVEKLEATLVELREGGTVLDESRTGRDVTEEYSDTRAELAAKRKLEERMLVVLSSAKTVKEMLEVESELARVRGEADKLEGRTRYLESHAAFATINLSIVSPTQPVEPIAESVSSRLKKAFSESCRLCFQVTTGLIVAFGAVSPLLVPAGVAFFLLRRRRAAQKALLSA
jgi:hypothetical protein